MDIRKFFGKKPAPGDAGTGAAAGGAADKPRPSGEDDKKKASSSSKAHDKKVAASPAAKAASKKSTAASAGTNVAPSSAAKNRKRPSAAEEEDDDEVEVVVKPKKRVVEPEADKKKGGPKEEAASPMEVDAEEDDGKGVAKLEASSGKKRVSAPRGAKEKGGAAGKKRRKVSKKSKDSDESDEDEESEEEEEEDDSDFEDMDASSEDEEDEEEESDDEFGSSKKKKGKDTKKGKAAASDKKKPAPVKKRKQVEVDDDDEDEVVFVSSTPSKGRGKKAESPKRTEISATEFFGSGTRSKFFSQGSPSPAKEAKAVEKPAEAKSAASPATAVKPEEEDKKPAKTAEPAVETKPAKEEVAARAAKEEPAKSPRKPGFGAYRGGAHTGGAMAPGSKEIPTGAPNCLDGKTFVFTGLMEALSREAADDLVKMYGGRVTSAVSGKTSYVVVGLKLEDGRPIEEGKKYKDAMAKKVKMLDEDAFLALIRDSPGKSAEAVLSGMSPKASKAKAPSSTGKGKAPASAVNPTAPSAASAGKGRAVVAPATSMLKAEQSKHEGNPCELWADKYRPRVAEDLIGSADLVRNLTRWLSQWDMVHRKKTMKIPYSKENPGAKAVLLSGPPGIGKSTVAGVVARAQGYDILELNASDTRSKKTLKEELGDVLDNSVLFMKHDKKGDHATAQNKRVVIMDEVDGMSGSDRGGMQELIRLIKTSKVPIICICNDRQSTKVRGLANNCYDLRVRRPLKQQISQRMMGIAAKEGLQVDRNAIEMLIESVGNDIRQVLNSMQMWKKTSSKMSYMDMKDRISSIEKDKSLRLSAFDAGKMIVGDGATTPFMDRYNAFFIDYSIVPLLVEQNYIDSIKHSKESLLEKLQRLDSAAEAVSDSDLVGKLIMGDGNWGLLPLQACMNVKVGYHTRGIIPFPTFPQWFGKNSTQGKKRRLTQELLMHMTGRVSGGFEAVRMHYVPALRERIVSYLERGAEGVPDVIELLDEYGMSRDDVMETLTELFLSPNGKDPLKDLDSKVKAAFTREYNKTVHMSQGLAHSEAFKVGGKGKKGGSSGGAAGGALDEDGTPLEAEGAEEDNNAEEEEVDDDDVSKFIAKKKKAPAKASKDGEGKGKGKASSGKAKAAGKKK